MRLLPVLVSLLLTGCTVSCDNRPTKIVEYNGTVTYMEVFCQIGNLKQDPYRIILGVELVGEVTKLFDARKSEAEENYQELRRIFLLNKKGDIVTVHWKERYTAPEKKPTK